MLSRNDYGDRWAPVYDGLYEDRDDLADVVRFVADRATPATILELGVGTGRLAIPLAKHGLAVHGVDNSAAMLDQLRAKPGGHAVTTYLGDMTAPSVAGPFGCVLIAFSTLYLLPDQDSQARCLASAAALLAEDGCLVVEGFIPDPDRWDDRFSLNVGNWTADELTCTVGRLNLHSQVIETVRIRLNTGTPEVLRNRLRFLWPTELDLLAERAGLRRAERYRDFAARPLESGSTNHVSVFTRGG
jgi:SAM-dependent methyltransferase